MAKKKKTSTKKGKLGKLSLNKALLRQIKAMKKRKSKSFAVATENSGIPPVVHLPIDIDEALPSVDDFTRMTSLNLNPMLQPILPENVLTSEDTSIEFDPESLTEGTEKKQSLGTTISKVSDSLSELDALIKDAETQVIEQGMPSKERSSVTKVTSRIKGDFLLEAKGGRKFGFEAELRHMTAVQNRLTYKMILTLAKAIRLQAFFQSVDTTKGTVADFGVRLMRLNIQTVYSDARPPEVYTIRMKRTKKGKFSVYKMCGMEIKKTTLLKAENALVTVSFSPNGW